MWVGKQPLAPSGVNFGVKNKTFHTEVPMGDRTGGVSRDSSLGGRGWRDQLWRLEEPRMEGPQWRDYDGGTKMDGPMMEGPRMEGPRWRGQG